MKILLKIVALFIAVIFSGITVIYFLWWYPYDEGMHSIESQYTLREISEREASHLKILDHERFVIAERKTRNVYIYTKRDQKSEEYNLQEKYSWEDCLSQKGAFFFQPEQKHYWSDLTLPLNKVLYPELIDNERKLTKNTCLPYNLEGIKLEHQAKVYKSPFKEEGLGRVLSFEFGIDELNQQIYFYPIVRGLSTAPSEWKFPLWILSPDMKLVKKIDTPPGDWNYTTGYALCFSCGCDCYDRIYFKIRLGKVFALVRGVGVKMKHKGIYQLNVEEKKWDSIITGPIGDTYDIDSKGCYIALPTPQESQMKTAYINICI